MDKKIPTEYDIEFIENTKKILKKIKAGKITIRNFEVSEPDDEGMYFNFHFEKVNRPLNGRRHQGKLPK